MIRDSWFKHVIPTRRSSNELPSGDVAFHNTELTYDCRDFGSDSDSRRPGTAFFIVPYLEDKKEKVNTHRNNILEIFYKWRQIRLRTSSEKTSCYTTSIPLYLGLAEQIEVVDQYSEGRCHLLSGYKSSFEIAERIRNLELKH